MDKSILKKFAIESRQDLMDKIKNKIKTFYIDEDFNSEQKGDVYVLSNEKHSLSLTNDEFKKRELLIKRVRELSLEQVIEEAAYTWFNRIIAIRYMEINDMLPLTKDNQSLGIRVLSSKDNTPDPEILKFSNLSNSDLDINFGKEKYVELKSDNEKFKYVLLLVCKKLGKVIPQVFDGVTDYIDILIPDNLLNDTGFITKVINEIPEDNYNQVEIIGWLYQYYNQAEKDRVINAKKPYKKNEIPYATQLFTPDWIVKYLVENSLGKYWIENFENSKLQNSLRYMINDNLDKKSKNIKPQEITFLDPCCGSGHILVYAFEVFYQMYVEAGFNKNDIAKLILENNLYGLDIDDRAKQLSILSIILKAREYDKNILKKIDDKSIKIMSIPETNTYNLLLDDLSENSKKMAESLIKEFNNGKDYGSLINIEKEDYTSLMDEIEKNDTIFGIEEKEKINPLIYAADILNKKYDIVVTNPPYMNDKYMNDNLKKFGYKFYKDYKADLFSMFFIKAFNMGKENGYISMLSPYVWMFIKRYTELRKYILDNKTIESLVQFEYNSFEAACVPVGMYVFKNKKDQNKGVYIKLSDFIGIDVQEKKTIEAVKNKECNYRYEINCDEFKKLPSYLICYWMSKTEIEMFNNKKKIGDNFSVKGGITTANTNLFLREWWEVSTNNIGFNCTRQSAKDSKKKWFPYNKGGEYRKWYGNREYLINWFNDGQEIKDYKLLQREKDPNYNVAIAGIESMFKEQISWSLIGIGNFNVRYYDSSFLFDVSGCVVLPENKDKYYLMGLLNSKVSERYIKSFNPTMNTTPGDVRNIPYIENKDVAEIDKNVKENIQISKEEWDSFETSWNFKKHPLLEFITSFPGLHDTNIEVPSTHINIKKNNYGEHCFIADEIPLNAKISDSYYRWNEFCNKQFDTLKFNEEELNRIFIDIYGLNDELTPEVDDKDITIRKADKERDIKSLISYAVGCMFGRYSLDEEGLVYAGGYFDIDRYKTFKVDNDNIIPITDEAYFSDDIVERFKTFIKTVYGDNTFNENMNFIAETLGKRGTETSEETIRRYFVNDFFNDHVKMYQKRPIYWLLDSGKKNGFKALVYMHRYNENLIPKVRLDYLHRIQTTYEKLLSDVNYKLTTDLSMTDKKEAKNRQADLKAKLNEIKEYDEKIAHIANQRISIDLDDGVKVNYEKFKDILAKIK